MKHNIKVHLALFIVTLIYAATFSIAKIIMPAFIPPEAFILLRVSVATVLIFLFHSLVVKEKLHSIKDLKPLLICAMFGVAFNMLFFFKGLAITTPINGAVLMMNTPIFVVVFAFALLKEPLSIYKITGILLATIGAMLLIGGSNFKFSSDTVIGDIYISINAIIYAFYLVYAKSLMQRYHPLTVTLWSFFIGFFFVLPFAADGFIHIPWQSFTTQVWLCVAFVTVGSTFFTYVLNAYALKHASSSLVGSYIYLQPVLAVIIALLLGKDTLSLSKLIHIAIIFSGVLLVNVKKRVASK